MTNRVVELLASVFAACVQWTDQLYEAIDGHGILVAALIITFVTSMLLMPLRGGGYTALGGAIGDYASSSMYTGKYWNGKSRVQKPGYRGKFLANNKSANITRRGKHTRYYAGGSGKKGL